MVEFLDLVIIDSIREEVTGRNEPYAILID
jgi:hypothetical protein